MREPGDRSSIMERAFRPLLGVLALCILVAVSVRRACACSTVESAYLTMLRSELRDAIIAQERYRETHGQYARDLLTVHAPGSPDVELTDFRLTASGFEIEMAVPSRTRTRCAVDYDGTQPIAICGDRPPRALHMPALPAPE